MSVLRLIHYRTGTRRIRGMFKTDDRKEDGKIRTGIADKNTTPLLGFTKKRSSSVIKGKSASKHYAKRRTSHDPQGQI